MGEVRLSAARLTFPAASRSRPHTHSSPPSSISMGTAAAGGKPPGCSLLPSLWPWRTEPAVRILSPPASFLPLAVAPAEPQGVLPSGNNPEFRNTEQAKAA